MTTNPWEKLRSEIIFKNPWLYLQKDTVITPTGEEGEYTLLVAKPFIIVMPVTAEGKILMIKQYRYPIAQQVIEFPSGGVDGTNLLKDAKRELQEETGYISDDWTDMGEIHELVSISRQPGQIFLARNCKDTGQHKMTEEGIEKVQGFTIDEVQGMIQDGTIIDALTPAVFSRVKHLL
jgi:8-oxo-dGTP pyrophosphatase MutT (NUDIX family)